MGYYEFTIKVTLESKDALINKISEIGCLGFQEREDTLIAYFEDRHDIIKLRDELKSFRAVLKSSGLDHDLSFDYLYLSERDWNESWKKKYIPIDLGENLSIIPPWENRKEGRINLIVDPGMAFGTGHHETTKTCLMLIEKFSKFINKERFLDIGTGTGILSIAASTLGFCKVLGIDIDGLAIEAAKKNIELNGLTNIEIKKGAIEEAARVFDMIAANLMSNPLIAIAPDLSSHLKDAGIAILSGMLVGQESGVIKAMEDNGLRVIEKVVEGRWISLVISR